MSSSPNNRPQWNLDAFQQILSLCATNDQNARIGRINSISDNDLMCLVELVYNIVNGSVDIPKRQVQQLAPHSQNLRHLSVIRDLDEAKEFLVQTGGSPIVALLPILISTASAILQNVLR